MLAVGDPIPQVEVWLGPQQRMSLRDIAREGPILLVFYLFDWSST
jgi:peroxiredoxin